MTKENQRQVILFNLYRRELGGGYEIHDKNIEVCPRGRGAFEFRRFQDGEHFLIYSAEQATLYGTKMGGEELEVMVHDLEHARALTFLLARHAAILIAKKDKAKFVNRAKPWKSRAFIEAIKAKLLPLKRDKSCPCYTSLPGELCGKLRKYCPSHRVLEFAKTPRHEDCSECTSTISLSLCQKLKKHCKGGLWQD